MELGFGLLSGPLLVCYGSRPVLGACALVLVPVAGHAELLLGLFWVFELLVVAHLKVEGKVLDFTFALVMVVVVVVVVVVCW